ncbi:hypothetical protein BX600DRAFT_151626 [Xylariales sp. PMI_506]|nr:hypothetical protein BX600DRAFT_151626 [Xylariales sp. PMI_506]
MLRKGIRRVRTGCNTCKTRKIKCDEARPVCQRCKSTGRTCDGYDVDSKSAGLGDSYKSWAQGGSILGETVYHPANQLPLHPGTPLEIRSLYYFRTTAGPMIAGYFDHDFWTSTIIQISISEPAVRHAMLAVSLSLEQYRNPKAGQHGELILQQCNKAIGTLLLVKDKDVVLLTCILFICFEFIHRQVKRALAHFDQGLRVLESILEPSSLSHILAPFFCRLCVFPMLFGHPLRAPISERWTREWKNIPARFESLDMARHSMSTIWVLALRSMRAAEVVRFEKAPVSVLSDSWQSEFNFVSGLMERWLTAFSALDTTVPRSSQNCLHVLKAQHLVVGIWLKVSLSSDQMDFDAYHTDFRAIVEDCTFVLEHSGMQQAARPFNFDTGIISLLYFVAAKCRYLATRLAALELLRRLKDIGLRENLWDSEAMHTLAQSIIEHEHNCSLEDFFREPQQQDAVRLPPRERRVWDFSRQDHSPPVHGESWKQNPGTSSVTVKLKDGSGWKDQQSYVP